MLYDETIFHDEMIVPRETRPDLPVPDALLEMRRIEKEELARGSSNAEIFFREARLLERFEDDYPFERPAERYIHTYRYYTNEDLRGYFTWRGQVRRGDIHKTVRSYAYLYINELLNQIGCTDVRDGYEKLKAFRDAYQELDAEVTACLDEWIRDYVVYHGLDSSLLPVLPSDRIEHAADVLMHSDAFSAHDITESLLEFSTYNIRKSKVYLQKTREVERVIAAVCRRLDTEYLANEYVDWISHCIGESATAEIELFFSAVFHETQGHASCDYVVNPLHAYHCRNGVWSVDFFHTPARQNRMIAVIVRMVDALMRRFYRFPSKLSFRDPTDWLTQTVTEIIQALPHAGQQDLSGEDAGTAGDAAFSIDHAALGRIRENAAYTRTRLMTEEEEETPVQEPVPVQETHPEPSEGSEAPSGSLLTPVEERYLRCLLDGSSTQWVREGEYMESVLTDSINEKLFDLFNDTVLEESTIIEDYRSGLERLLGPGTQA